MRNRVMYVQQVERFRFKHLEHFCRQRQRVGRMVEQRIAHDFYFVKMNSFTVGIQPDWGSVTDEMNVVAARGKFDAKLRGHDAGAAVSRVASDANAHGVGVEAPPLS